MTAEPPVVAHQPIALVDLLDRLLAGGVVISGEIRLSIADVDLVTVSLQALISSVSTAFGSEAGAAETSTAEAGGAATGGAATSGGGPPGGGIPGGTRSHG
jgi:gas vesicle protein GvpA/GvpJ/GvpM family